MTKCNVVKTVCHIKYDHELTNLPEIRHRLLMTQKQLSELFGVTVDTVQAWENGRKNPSGTSKKLLDMLALDPKATISLLQKAA